METNAQYDEAGCRDRLLAYLEAYGLEPQVGLTLVLDVLKNSPKSMAENFQELERLLAERGLEAGAVGDLKKCAEFLVPPLNRSSMLPENMDISISKALGHLIFGGFQEQDNELGFESDNTSEQRSQALDKRPQ